MTGKIFRNIILTMILVVIGFVLLAACASSGEIEVNEANNGDRIEIQQGKILAVKLESNPTTGFQWDLQELGGSALQQKGEAEYEPAVRNNPPPGSGGWQIFRFEALNAGEAQLELVYHRPWETDEPPIGTFLLQVVVVASQ